MTAKRITWIDSLKGFAILCVVLGHIADGYLSAGLFPEYRGILRAIYNGTYLFHMPLFFALSGMVFQIAYVEKETGKLKKNRLRTQSSNLIFLYVMYCFLIWIFKLCVSKYVNKPVEASAILWILGKPIYPYWYLYVLLVQYLLFAIDKVRTCDPRILLPVLLCMSAVSGYVDTHDWFQIKHILQYTVFFYLGILLAEGSDIRLFSPSLVILLLTVSAAVTAVFWNADRYICSIPFFNTVAALGIVMSLLYLFSRVPIFEKRVLSLFGRYSLEIYLIHCFLTAGNRVLFSKIGIENFWASVALNLLISTAAPMILALLAKSLGFYDLFFRPGRLLE